MTEPHDPERMDAEALEQASLHALGATDEAEARAYEAHLDDCRACEAEVEAHRPVADLALTAEPITPPESLLGRVLERARATANDVSTQPWKSWAACSTDDLTFSWADTSSWQPIDVEGVEVRRLSVDAERDRVTMLVRMAPGTSYPAHRHNGPEECYVLEGDLHLGEETMRQGDYQYAPEDSVHPVQWTTAGCLLFIRSSLSDELLSA